MITKFHPNGIADLAVIVNADGSKNYHITSRRADFGYDITVDKNGKITKAVDLKGTKVEAAASSGGYYEGLELGIGSGNKKTQLSIGKKSGTDDNMVRITSSAFNATLDYNLSNGTYDYTAPGNETHVGNTGAYYTVANQQSNGTADVSIYTTGKFVGNALGIPPKAINNIKPTLVVKATSRDYLADGTLVLNQDTDKDATTDNNYVISRNANKVYIAEHNGIKKLVHSLGLSDASQDVKALDGGRLSDKPQDVTNLLTKMGITTTDGIESDKVRHGLETKVKQHWHAKKTEAKNL